MLDRRQPLDLDPLLEGLLELGLVRGHPVAGAAVDDDRLVRAQPLGGAGGVHRGVAAAVDGDPPAQQRRAGGPILHVAQQRDRVDDLAPPSRRGRRRGWRAGADGQEDGVETPLELLGDHVGDVVPELELHAELGDPLDLGVEDLARKAVLGNPVAHHPAGDGGGVPDRHLVSEQRQVVGGREARRAGADHEHALAAGRRGRLRLPALR